MKKICVYYKNNYLFTTTRFNTIKELKKDLETKQGTTIEIASVPKSKQHIVENIKNYDFVIDKGGF